MKSSLFDFRGTPLENKAKEAKEALAMAEEKIEDLVSSAPEVDPQEVDRLNRRLYDLGELRRKYGKKTSDILASLKDFKERLEALQTFEEDKARKESEVEAKRREAVSEAEALSRERKKVAADLSAKVCDEMSHLGLSKGGFRISFHERAEMCAEGKDEAIYEVCLNKGFRFAPLSEAASGGEGSRLMLSLKAVLQKANPCDCLIFDEIDSGISGKVAFKAGRMMRDLSGDVQILCITHLPQVACFADRGIEVKKTDGGDKAIAVAEVLTSDGLATAVATMLGGENPTRESRRAAEELIREASSGKSDP